MKAELIQHMGDDLTVVNAARVSFDKESEWVEFGLDYVTNEPILFLGEGDKKLISYLAKHGHWTPFSHCTITLRETIPIFVARQRFKHMVGFTYNEVSRRYVSDEPNFFTPDGWRRKAENVKQGSSSELVEDVAIDEEYHQFLYQAYTLYKTMLDAGIAPELARMVLPQSMYTSYYVTGSLYAFARAYNLRSDPHAQKEIQDLAAMWDEIIRPLYPVSWDALTRKD
jgi:thymidylate synthase (FAD)